MLELNDIQGNILAGFNTDFQVIVGLAYQETVSDWQKIALWLSERAEDITTVENVKSQRAPIKERFAGNELTWLCLGLSERLMSATQPDVIFTDDAFRRGMIKRAGPVLGDRTPPENWRIGGTNTNIDVLLIIAANNQAAAEGRAEQLIQSALAAGLIENYRETAGRIEDLEHFGFRDGISQPRIIGYDSQGELEAGNFVYGYPLNSDSNFSTVYADPRGLTKNGSLMVIRRLKQDVKKFQDFCEDEADKIRAQWPQLTADHLQALIVGRWPHGAVVSISDDKDPGVLDQDNNFTFSDDSEGLKCPFGAHIRKVNPRQGPKDVVNVPRLLRRGIPFGPRYEVSPDTERGLMFISFQTSIVNTFEFISAKWMNSPEKPPPNAGYDLLVGRSLNTRSLNLNSPDGPVLISVDTEPWVTPSGGAYLFAPSKSGLAKFATPPVTSLQDSVVKRWLQFKDFLAVN